MGNYLSNNSIPVVRRIMENSMIRRGGYGMKGEEIIKEKGKDGVECINNFASEVLTDEVLKKLVSEGAYNIFKNNSANTFDRPFADIIANAMKEWAIKKGATHYTHWFQPMTGSTAEKHDSFLKYKTSEGENKLVLDFS